MEVRTLIYINDNPYLKKYLKEHSYFYKYLNRDPSSVNLMKEEMEKEYKLTTEDKLEKLSDSIKTVSNIINILK